MSSVSSGSDREWDEKTLTKTSSNLSSSDLDCDKQNKQQSSLFIHKLYGMVSIFNLRMIVHTNDIGNCFYRNGNLRYS